MESLARHRQFAQGVLHILAALDEGYQLAQYWCRLKSHQIGREGAAHLHGIQVL